MLNIRNRNLILVLVVILFLFISVNLLISNSISSIVEIRKIPANLVVSDRSGFNLENNSLLFGQLVPGGSSSRNISFKNNFNFPVKIQVYGNGIMGYFIIPSNSIIFSKSENILEINVKVPEDTRFGNYSGEITLIAKRFENN
jgi:hypothetical protein